MARLARARTFHRTWTWRAAMSWSFLDPAVMRSRNFQVGVGLLCAAVVPAAPVIAAEIYVQPIATLTAETDSNLDLDPSTKQEVQGYLADVATVIGYATPD